MISTARLEGRDNPSLSPSLSLSRSLAVSVLLPRSRSPYLCMESERYLCANVLCHTPYLSASRPPQDLLSASSLPPLCHSASSLPLCLLFATLPRLCLLRPLSRSLSLNLALHKCTFAPLDSRSLAQSGGGVGERARQRVGGEHVDGLVGGVVGCVVSSVHSCVGERAQKRKIKQDETLLHYKIPKTGPRVDDCWSRTRSGLASSRTILS